MLVFDPEPFLEAFYLARSVDDALLPGEEGVTLTTYFDLQCSLSCADDKGIATRTDNLCLIIVFGVYLIFHYATSTPTYAEADFILKEISRGYLPP